MLVNNVETGEATAYFHITLSGVVDGTMAPVIILCYYRCCLHFSTVLYIYIYSYTHIHTYSTAITMSDQTELRDYKLQVVDDGNRENLGTVVVLVTIMMQR